MSNSQSPPWDFMFTPDELAAIAASLAAHSSLAPQDIRLAHDGAGRFIASVKGVGVKLGDLQAVTSWLAWTCRRLRKTIRHAPFSEDVAEDAIEAPAPVPRHRSRTTH